MHKIPMTDRRFTQPTNVVIEASIDTIRSLDLKMLDGEQYDTIEAVIGITADADQIAFETVRTHAAWKRGEANAGRGIRTFDRSAIEAVWIGDDVR